ncbi:MAG: hypothetical protein H7Y33_04360 [Cytophagales bacterium]|nr:hypothetical protein [Rhizobacter sp.]
MIPIQKAMASDFVPMDDAKACGDCSTAERLGFQFSFAYQPIVNIETQQIFAREALVRGLKASKPSTSACACKTWA